MKIYTKTGDDGTTALVGGRRVSKTDERIEAYGTLDELNVWVGLLKDLDTNKDRQHFLKRIQDRLFSIGARVSTPEEKVGSRRIPLLSNEDVVAIEDEIDRIDSELTPLRYFVLPGGVPVASYAHLARVCCRRAERVILRLNEVHPVEELILQYLNRLSDYFFVLSRKVVAEYGADEVYWVPDLKS